MVKILEEFPRVHVTFNFVPLLAEQIEEYVGGRFQEPGSTSLSPMPAACNRNKSVKRSSAHFRSTKISSIAGLGLPSLRLSCALAEPKRALLTGPFATGATCNFSPSSHGWTRNISPTIPSFTRFPKKARISRRKIKPPFWKSSTSCSPRFSSEDQRAAARGQIEISTTPYYHPILPLLCDTDIARVANPHTPLPHPAFRYPRGCPRTTRPRTKLPRASFRQTSRGLWPSEGSVSDQAPRNCDGPRLQMVCYG